MSKYFFQPVTPFRLNQRFGENQACVDLKTNSKYIVCDGNNPPTGYKSVYGPKGHLGIDLYATHGTPVYAACAGTVDSIDTNPRTGLDVKMVSEVGGKKYKHIYEHLLGYQPKVGDWIEVGGLVGWADNTGYSAGDHLHFELQEWIKGRWVSIDPLPLMDDIYALKFAGLWRQVKELTARVAELLADAARKKQ